MVEIDEQERVNKFVEAYKELCDAYKLSIIVTPQWRQSRDTGAWMMVLEPTVQKLNLQEKE